MKTGKGIVLGIVLCVLMTVNIRAEEYLTRIYTDEIMIQVNNGVPMELFAFVGDGAMPGGAGMPAVCFYDLAFLLRDTPSRFSFRETSGTNLDFWIERGTRHEGSFGLGLFGINFFMMGNRLIYLDCDGNIQLSSSALFQLARPWPDSFWWIELRDFYTNPFRRISIGIDGENETKHIIHLDVFYKRNSYFVTLEDLSFWLGFSFYSKYMLTDYSPEYSPGFHIRTNVSLLPLPGRHINRDTFQVGTTQIMGTANTLTVRRGPGNNYAVAFFLRRGDEVRILDYSRRFVQIESSQGIGWISPRFFTRPQDIRRIPDAGEGARLWQIIQSISGTWVYRAYIYEDFIDSAAAFPRVFKVNNRVRTSFDFLSPFDDYSSFRWTTRMPLMIEKTDGYLVTLKYNTSLPKHFTVHNDYGFAQWNDIDKTIRIIVDTSQNPVESIRYYIGDSAYTMVRWTYPVQGIRYNESGNIYTVWWTRTQDKMYRYSRFSYHMVEDGLRLGWIIEALSMEIFGDLVLYRSASPYEKGERLRINPIGREATRYYTFGMHPWPEWLYSFVDTNVTEGVFYYSLWIINRRTWGLNWSTEPLNVPIGGRPYMRVVVR